MVAAEVGRSALISRRSSLMALGAATGLTGLGSVVSAEAVGRNRGVTVPTAAPTERPDWQKIACEFLVDPEIAYLNTGSLGSVPRSVLELRRQTDARLEANPVSAGFGPVLAEAEAVRPKLAELLGCRTEEIAVTRNTTEGINLVAEGLNLQPGDRVLTSNHEHGGGLGGWRYLVKRRGVHLDVARLEAPPESEDEVVAQFAAAIRPETRVLSVSHVTFSSGVQVPIAKLSELAHANNCLMVVDGAQAPGGVLVDVKSLGCDAYASSGHKWLLGPKGTGVLYLSERVKDRITPMTLDDGYGVYTAIRGTANWPETIGLGTSLDFVKAIGREVVAERLMALRNLLYEALSGCPGIRIFSPPPGSSMACHLVCFSVTDRAKHPLLTERFAADKVVVKTVGVEGIDFRVGCHLYNTEQDVRRFGGSLHAVLG